MVRKFTITMEDGYKVNNLDELKEHFDINTVMGCFNDGRLLRWLKDRKLSDLAEQVGTLSRLDRNLAKKLCAVFGLEPGGGETLPLWIIEIINRLRNNYTNDEELLNKIKQELLTETAHVAFNQMELDEYVKNFGKIYLVSSHFTVPLDMKDKIYIGIGEKTTAFIDSKGYINRSNRNIEFENISIEDKNPPDKQLIEKVRTIIDKLRSQYTSDKNLLKQIGQDLIKRIAYVAFNQTELDEHVKNFGKFYLVSSYFTVPLDMRNKIYIGIGKETIAFIESKEKINFDNLNIKFENIVVRYNNEQTFSEDFAEIRKLIVNGGHRTVKDGDYRVRCIMRMETLEKRLEAEENAAMLRELAVLYEKISLPAYAKNCRYKAEQIEKNMELTAVKLYDEGIAAYEERNYVLALEKLKKSYELGHAQATYRIAIIYERMGNKRDADRWYNRLQKLRL